MPNTASQHPKRGWFRNALPFWLILPTIVVLLVVQVYPALYTVWLSLQEREPKGWTFVGIENFQRLFGTSRFGESVGHTMVFLVGYAGLTMIAGFLIALITESQATLVWLLYHTAFHPLDYCRHYCRSCVPPVGDSRLWPSRGRPTKPEPLSTKRAFCTYRSTTSALVR